MCAGHVEIEPRVLVAGFQKQGALIVENGLGVLLVFIIGITQVVLESGRYAVASGRLLIELDSTGIVAFLIGIVGIIGQRLGVGCCDTEQQQYDNI